MKKKFVIFIGSEQKGLLCAIADILEKKYNIRSCSGMNTFLKTSGKSIKTNIG